ETDVEAEAPVLAEGLQQDAGAREDVRAMRDRGAGPRHPLEIAAPRPADPAVLVNENTMRDDGAVVEHAEPIEPFDRRLAVALGHLAKLDHALRGVDLHRCVARLRGL